MLPKILIGLALVTAIISGLFYWYYQDSQEKLAILNKNNAKLEVATQVYETTLNAMEENQAALEEELIKINEEFATIRKQNTVLTKKLADHDLGLLAAAKPKTIQRIVTNASNKAGRCIEILSGSELTETELNATSAKRFNSECPWLWPGGAE